MNVNASNDFSKLIMIIKRLRAPEGCPWDQKQTVESFKPYLIEEMHELLEAISINDHQHIMEELGDVLFQLIFINSLYEEQDIFTLSDVIKGITEKMVHRHPHVFSDTKYSSDKEFRKNWNLIKAEEKDKKGVKDKGLFDYPKSLPGLMRAHRVSARAVSSGFEWPDVHGVMDKLDEEFLELKEAVASEQKSAIEDELGDMFFTLVNVARKHELDPESVMQKSTDKFIRRFTKMSKIAEKDGHHIEDLDINKMQCYWETAKKNE